MRILETYLAANRCATSEYAWEPIPVEGMLPTEISGTLYRNGNGRFEHHGVVYKHLFDGDGMVSAFRFEDGQLLYSNRYVRTREFEAEEKAGRMLFRSFGTNTPGGFFKNALRLHFKNAANTSIRYHGGKLLALWEGGLPHEIDPDTLETKSRFHYSGALLNPFSFLDRQINPEMPFSAHPKIQPDTGEMFNFGTLAGVQQRLMVYRISPDGQAKVADAVPMPGVTFTHDFILTAGNKLVFFFTPVQFELWKAFLGFQSPVESISVQKDKPTSILLIDNGQRETFETDFGFVFHFANGFETETGQVVVDALTMPDFPDANLSDANGASSLEAPAGKLTRYTIDRQTKQVQKTVLSHCPVELPYINQARVGKPYQYLWCIGDPEGVRRPYLHSIVKIDTHSGHAVVNDLYPNLPGEPVFIPREHAVGEDDGWLTYMVFDPVAIQTTLHICDAATLQTVGIATLPHNTPVGFHGTWVPSNNHRG
jgi:all-trans-8'-apo-beta-carotenal 15,15'-oxygenase